MSNLFDRVNYPVQEPDTIVIGDRLVWRRDDLANTYPIGSYALTYEFHEDSGGGGSHKFTITATEAEDTYFIEVASSTTASYTDGDFIWNAFITRSSDSQRIRVDTGRTTVVKNLANTNADLRSHAKKVLDAVQAVLENRASVDQASFSIAGRSLSRMSIDELLSFRDKYKAEYLQEIKKARIKNKQRSGNTIEVKF
jgi:hypothetical protein|tara:strand:- start:1695 stop:2285 length:591 start_codon:yes stop_codon:yes gene_type:complete